MKKYNIFKFSIKMFFVFLLVFLLCQFGSAFLYSFTIKSKYSMMLICEILMTFIIIAVLLLSGNKYTFIYKKEKFFKSIKLAIPLILFSLFYLLIGLLNVFVVQDGFNIFNFVTVILLCISIGFFEELLCRGWVLNQYLKRFSNTKEGAIKSIVISSLFFGLLHSVNLIAGQSLLLTVMQVIQTSALGFLWGVIYFKTKNIWSCIFLHGFYDFCLIVSNINYIKDPVADNGLLVSILTTIFLSLAWISQGVKLLNKSTFKEMSLIDEELKEEDYIKEEKNNSKYNVITIISLVLCFVSAMIFSKDTKVIEFKYEEVKMDKYITHFINYDEYVINNLSISLNGLTGLDIKDNSNNKSITINKIISSYSVIENDNYFELLIYDGTNLYYGKYDYSVNINNIEKELVKISVPTIINIGYLTNLNEKEKQPYFITDTKYEFIVKDSKLFLIK